MHIERDVARIARPLDDIASPEGVREVVAMRALWVVYDNSNKKVDSFPYNQKAEAEALLARKLEEKKGTFFLNLVKEEMKDE